MFEIGPAATEVTQVGPSRWNFSFTFGVPDEALRMLMQPSRLLGMAHRVGQRYPRSSIEVDFAHVESSEAPSQTRKVQLGSDLASIAVNSRLQPDPANRSALFGALEARDAAIYGVGEVIDSFSRAWLQIPAPKAAQWREAVSLALMGDWGGALAGQRFTEEGMVQILRRETHIVHRQLQPLWERKVGGHRLHLLDKPVPGGTLQDLVTDGQGPDMRVLRTVVDDLRLEAVLNTLDPTERKVARAWAYGGAQTWAEAARWVAVENPAALGERVRRKLRRQGREYLQRRTGATASGLWLPPKAIPSRRNSA